jgi:hypothetical protein
MQPWYRKFETYNVPPEALGQAMGSDYIEPKLRGTDGPIQTSFCESLSVGWRGLGSIHARILDILHYVTRAEE